MRLWCDLETYSATDLSKSGAYRYAEDCEVLLWGYAVDDGPARVWDLTSGLPMPADLKAAIDDPTCMTIWHNGMNFDTNVLRHARNIHVDLPFERIEDTMVIAYSHGLPGSLKDLGDVFGLTEDQAKERDGARLVQKFSKPRKDGLRATKDTDPDDWSRFVHYCGRDVEAMRTIARMLPRWQWGDYDRKLYRFDQKIAQRGIKVDIALAKAAVSLDAQFQADITHRLIELTQGYVTAASQRERLIRYIGARWPDLHLKDLRAGTVTKLLEAPGIPEDLKEILRARAEGARSSIAKYRALLAAVSSDGRLHGVLQFRGASRTGRYAGRIFQPQNLPRPALDQWTIDRGVEAVKEGWADLFADTDKLLTSCLRSCIIAPEGRHLVDADLSNIEGRMLAWLAGEQWKIEAFRAFDRGEGPDLYKATYARTFGIKPEQVDKHQRQIGKVMELSLGYRGGVAGFKNFAAIYHLDLDELAEHVRKTLSEDELVAAENAAEWFDEHGLLCGLPLGTFTAVNAIKDKWRKAQPCIVKFWKDLEEAVSFVVGTEGVKRRVGHVEISYLSPAHDMGKRKDYPWLLIRLPSGRFISYPGFQFDSASRTFSYLEKQGSGFARVQTHGGKLAENITQAAAYDVLAEAMPRIEAAGFEIVFSVHDEYITEAPLNKNSKELAALMSQPPRWAPDLPLAAAGWEAHSYRKD